MLDLEKGDAVLLKFEKNQRGNGLFVIGGFIEAVDRDGGTIAFSIYSAAFNSRICVEASIADGEGYFHLCGKEEKRLKVLVSKVDESDLGGDEYIKELSV